MIILIHDYAGHPFPVGLSRELALRGHTVIHAFASELLTPRGDLARRRDDPAGLSFRPVPMSPDYRKKKYNFIKRLCYEHSYGHELVNLLNEIRPDVVLSGQTPSDPQWTLLKAARKQGIPVVTWVQDFYSIAVDKLARKKLPLVGAMAGWWFRQLDRLSLQNSSGIVSITDDFTTTLITLGVDARRISVIPNWASLDDFSPQPRLNPWSSSQGYNDYFVFLYAGTLAMKHNPDLILAVARHFRGDVSVRIVMISEGPGANYLAHRKEIEALTNLVILPFQPLIVMPDVLGSADVVMAVLERDAGVFSVPSKVLSYHAAGKAILAAIPKENLAARIINQHGSGLCVDPDDVAGFVKNATVLKEESSTRKMMEKRSRDYAIIEFDIKRITDRFEAVFRKAMVRF